MYPEKIISSHLHIYAKIFVPYTADCEYQLDFRSMDKDRPWRVATFYHPTEVNYYKN